MKKTDRRQFLQLLGMGTMAGAFNANIAKALATPANNRTGTILDVEHIVILMQENRPFDHHFGTLRGVRGFSDPRAVKIHLPLQSGSGTIQVPVFLQPAGAANVAAGYGVPPNYGTLGGPADGAYVIPPFRVNPQSVSPGLTSLGLTYLPGTDHGWTATHLSWNLGQYDSWASVNGPMVMSYMTREDLPYHYALADAFTVLDDYHCGIMGPTNPNRCYLWTGCVGNVDYLGAAGTDGHGAGPITYNGLSVNGDYLAWETLPEVLQRAGVTWRIYQDLSGQTFSPDFGDGGAADNFDGNYTDNPLLYFNQYATSAPGTPLFDNACTGTQLVNIQPPAGSPDSAWKAWALHQFDQFRSDVHNGTLPQVSWIIAPAGYTEHSDFPINYGAWYISQVLDILVSRPDVFSKTVFILNYDEADGSFDHISPGTAPATAANGASTADFHNEIVNDPASTPSGPIGLGTRVPCVVVSPWSKGGYVNSQVFDHTSVIQFIEKRFGVFERNLSPWRRAVSGDLTSVFNFTNPNDAHVELPSTEGFLPSTGELAGTSNPSTFVPTLNDVLIGVPPQEKGIRPSRALPYELHVHSSVDGTSGTVTLEFMNAGQVGAVFQVRSGNAADPVRMYTVEAGKSLSGTWNVSGSYDLSVYGPNGFVRYLKGSVGAAAAVLGVHSRYGTDDGPSLQWSVSNATEANATVTVLDAYSGNRATWVLKPNQKAGDESSLRHFHGWYDLVVTVAEDPSFEYRLAGHVETGQDSFSDPALGGLVTLKA